MHPKVTLLLIPDCIEDSEAHTMPKAPSKPAKGTNSKKSVSQPAKSAKKAGKSSVSSKAAQPSPSQNGGVKVSLLFALLLSAEYGGNPLNVHQLTKLEQEEETTAQASHEAGSGVPLIVRG